ncbi:cilia- and flagella-associated protein 74-like isoform X3 [Atheta coriaria]
MKILEAKLEHDENTLTNAEKMYQNKAKALSMLRKDYRMSIHEEDLTEKVVEKILKVKNAQRNNVKNVNRNRVHVVANILRDMRRDKKEKKQKSIKTQKSRKIQSFEDDDSTYKEEADEDEGEGEGEEESISSLKNSDFEEESYKSIENVESKKKIVENKKKKKTPSNLSIKNTKNTKKQKESPKQDKKTVKTSKTSKISKKTEKTPEDIIPPQIPNPNPRKKVLPEYAMTDLLENITKLYDYLKEKESYEIQDGLTQDILLPLDEGFFSRPNKIIFKDYEPGKKYKKIISIVNGNRNPKKIRLDRIIWNANIEEDQLLEVESMGIRRVLPGMSFKACLRFAPEVLNKTADGKIIFVTNKLRSDRSRQFVLNVVCVPLCAAVLISPTVVSFEEMPIWRAQSLMKQGRNYKTITISNSGLKECKVVVTKIFNHQTMEQEWKKIISIIRIDDITSDSDRKQLSSSNLEDPKAADPFPRNLVQQCVESVFNVFKFDRNVFNVQPKTTVVIKCWLKDLSEAGYQVESYNFSIYERFLDGQLYCIGTQDVIVNSETTSHFLTSNVEILDFEVCVYGSAYQLDFDLTNPCKLAHHIRICFPSRMKQYLQANPAVTTILPNQTIKICIKFLPIEGILLDNKFYDAEVCLLEFPVYVTVQTRGYEDTPPLRVDVFAAVTESQGVVIDFGDKIVSSYENGVEFYDLGSCTTVESVYFDLIVHNNSLVPQQFGFLSLPHYVTITPNYGFGQLKPKQKASVRVIISPSRQDIMNNDGCLKFQVVLSTIKHCGALKKKRNDKDLEKKLKEMEDFVCKSRGSNSSKLKEDIKELKQAVKKKTLSISTPSKSSASVDRFIQALDDDELLINLVKYDIEEEKEVSSNNEAPSSVSQLTSPITTFNFRVCVVDVAVELSHQILNFPDTPCGSYSSMTLDIITHKSMNMKYQVFFEISSCNPDCKEIEVQPSIGKLPSNKKKTIWVTVKPNIPQKVIEERAKVLKKAENDKNFEENDIAGYKKQSKVKFGRKDSSKASSKPVKQQKTRIKEDISTVVDLDDYYQTEMNIWRTLEPYYLEGLFTCRITYVPINNAIARQPEEIQFKVTCTVVAPNFIHDQQYQVIDFGCVPVGLNITKTINFQNIQRRNISIVVSDTNPLGPFSSTAVTNYEIPPEYIYSFPLKFTPTEDSSVMEFLDVTSDSTSYPFILRGIGIKPRLIFTPEFNVCRLTAQKGNYQDCVFEVKNDSDITLNLYLQKVCELEGTITQPEVQDNKKLKKSNSPQKKAKFSFDLYDEEIYALKNTFKLRESTSSTLFHVICNSELVDTFIIEAQSKCSVKIRFGVMSAPTKESKKKKGKDKEKASKSTVDNGKYFIVKYNMFIGLNYIKDFVIISNIT